MNGVFSKKADRLLEGVEAWTAYYRQRVDKFIEDFYGIHLRLFQKIIILMMNFCDMTVFIGSRGLSKTYLTALYASARCILYPGITIVTTSKTRKQGQLILGKIKDIFMVDSALFRGEIEDIKLNQYDSEVVFKNGSRIVVASFNQNSRGVRAQCVLYDEARLCDPTLIASVFRKFLTSRRHIGAQDKPEYADYETEPCQEIYLSSAWYKSSWLYDLLKSTTANMITGATNSFCCCLPYQIAIKEKLLSPDRVLIDLSDNTTDEITWTHEMLSLFWSGTDGALYNYDDISGNRKIKYAFYPPALAALLKDKRVQIPKKLHNETRIVSCDIALMASQKGKSDNDATSIFVNQMLFNADGRAQKNIVYTENAEGKTVDEQALQIRKLFANYDGDYLVIDARGVGLGVVDLLMQDIYDPETGQVYEALSCCNNPEIAARCKVKGAPKKIWAVTATMEFNNDCALGLREEFKRGSIRILISEDDAEEYLSEIPAWSKLEPAERVMVKLPYIDTTLLINELINLEYETRNNVVRVKEKSGMRKDRFSSLSYNCQVARIIEKEHEANDKHKSFQDIVMQFRSPNIYSRR